MTYVDGLLSSLTRVKKARSLRASSWDTTGRNNDALERRTRRKLVLSQTSKDPAVLTIFG